MRQVDIVTRKSFAQLWLVHVVPALSGIGWTENSHECPWYLTIGLLLFILHGAALEGHSEALAASKSNGPCAH